MEVAENKPLRYCASRVRIPLGSRSCLGKGQSLRSLNDPIFAFSVVKTLTFLNPGTNKSNTTFVSKKSDVLDRDIVRTGHVVNPIDEKGNGTVLEGNREVVRVLVNRRNANRRRTAPETAVPDKGKAFKVDSYGPGERAGDANRRTDVASRVAKVRFSTQVPGVVMVNGR
jgi:hypothetical protein